MKSLRHGFAALILALTSQVSTALEPVDPSSGLVPLYLFTGVQSSGAADTGIATAITCTAYATLSPAVANAFKIEYYNPAGAKVSGFEITFSGTDKSFTFVTNAVQSLSGEWPASPDPTPAFTGGAARVLVTKAFAKNTQCTAQVLDAATASPVSAVQLNGERSGKFQFPKP